MLEQQLVNGLMLGSVYALVAVAFTFAIGVLNFLNFSIPGLFMVGGMSTWFALRAGVPWPLAALLAVALGGLLSLVVERFTWRLMSRSGHFVPLVTSMAFLILFENLALIVWGSDVQRLSLPFQSVSFRIGATVVAVPQLPAQFDAATYDIVLYYAWAMREAKVTGDPKRLAEERTAIRDALKRMRNFPALEGAVSFGADNDALKPVYVQEVRDGKWVLLETHAAPN